MTQHPLVEDIALAFETPYQRLINQEIIQVAEQVRSILLDIISKLIQDKGKNLSISDPNKFLDGLIAQALCELQMGPVQVNLQRIRSAAPRLLNGKDDEELRLFLEVLQTIQTRERLRAGDIQLVDLRSKKSP